MTPLFGICDDYVTRWAALDPVAAGMLGLTGVFGAATDYSPDGYAARGDLITATLTALTPTSVTSDAEAMRRPGFNLKRWHTALSLGPIGLAGLADALAGADLNP
jgi:hypothetical protein